MCSLMVPGVHSFPEKSNDECLSTRDGATDGEMLRAVSILREPASVAAGGAGNGGGIVPFVCENNFANPGCSCLNDAVGGFGSDDAELAATTG